MSFSRLPSRSGLLGRLRAFTMIELIVVVVILGLLASVAAVSYRVVVDRSQHAALEAAGQQFLKEARALAGGDQGEPSAAVSVAAGDLPSGWSFAQGAADVRKVRLSRPDGAWVCVQMPATYAEPGLVTGTGLSGVASSADTCPEPDGGTLGPAPTATSSTTVTPSPAVSSSAPALVAPANLTYARSAGKVSLSWSGVPGATSYQVLRDGEQKATTAATSYADTTVVDAAPYTYAVVASAGTVSSPVSAALPVAPRPDEWATVSAGNQHTLALTSNGKLYSWGYNHYGQLGDGTTVTRTAPVHVRPDLTWSTVAAGGDDFSSGLTTDGHLYTWGYGYYGQLGINSSGMGAKSLTPVAVMPDVTWSGVAAGRGHMVAVTTDGRLFTWGYNGSGQLGTGNTTARSVPGQVRPDLRWASVGAGADFSAAITTDGHLYTWGQDSSGQLGDGGTNTAVRAPARIREDLSWSSIAGGTSHAVAHTTDGRLFAWGGDAYGQIGNDVALVNQTTPVQVGVGHTWRAADAGVNHTAAVTADGALYTWGGDGYGQIGDGAELVAQPLPVQIRPDVTWSAVSVHSHTAAVTAGGALFVWGSDNGNQLGDDARASNRPTPVQVTLP